MGSLGTIIERDLSSFENREHRARGRVSQESEAGKPNGAKRRAREQGGGGEREAEGEQRERKKTKREEQKDGKRAIGKIIACRSIHGSPRRNQFSRVPICLSTKSQV